MLLKDIMISSNQHTDHYSFRYQWLLTSQLHRAPLDWCLMGSEAPGHFSKSEETKIE